MVESIRLSIADDGNGFASSADVIERPSTGVVLTIVSGHRAGEMIGTDENEFLVGYHPDCFVRFSPSQYPDANARLLLRRSREGWCVTQVSGDPAFVNQRLVEGRVVLRSGDIVRLSALGPDVQFTLQSGGLAVKSLVHRFLPQAPAASQVVAPDFAAGSVAGQGNSQGAARAVSDPSVVSTEAATTAPAVVAVPVQAGPVQAGPVQAGPVQAGPVQAGPVQAPATDLTPREFAAAAAVDVMKIVRRKRTVAGLPLGLVVSVGLLAAAIVVLLVVVVSGLLWPV